MESALLSLFSLVFFVFAFGIAIVVMGFRAIVEAIYTRLKPVLPDKVEDFLADVWNEWILPSAPIIIGGFLAYFVSDYPYPADFAVSVSGRVFFGLISGFFSSTVYRFAKYHLKKYLPEEMKKKVDAMSKRFASIQPPPNAPNDVENNPEE